MKRSIIAICWLLLETCKPEPSSPIPYIHYEQPKDMALLCLKIEKNKKVKPYPLKDCTKEPKRRLLAIVTEITQNKILIIDLDGESPASSLTIPVGDTPSKLTVSPNSTWIASANLKSKDITLIETLSLFQKEKIKSYILTLPAEPTYILFSEDSQRLYTSLAQKGLILEISIPEKKIKRSLNLKKYIDTAKPWSLILTKDNNKLISTDAGTGIIWLIDLKEMKLLSKIPLPSPTKEASFLPELNLLYAINSSGNILAIDVKNKTLINTNFDQPRLLGAQIWMPALAQSITFGKIEKWEGESGYLEGTFGFVSSSDGYIYLINVLSKDLKGDLFRPHTLHGQRKFYLSRDLILLIDGKRVTPRAPGPHPPHSKEFGVVLQPNPITYITETWSIKSGGEIPNTKSNTGNIEQGNMFWDLEVNFCDLGIIGTGWQNGGIGPGDLLVIDEEPEDLEECEPWSKPPLEFYITKVYAHALEVLKKDIEYPPERCFPSWVSYKIRVKDRDWIVTGKEHIGFLHRIKEGENGECIIDEQRDLRFRGRAYRGRRFENLFFYFELDEYGVGMTTPLGWEWRFKTRGEFKPRKIEVGYFAAKVIWLPIRDSLYVLEGFYPKIVEISLTNFNRREIFW